MGYATLLVVFGLFSTVCSQGNGALRLVQNNQQSQSYSSGIVEIYYGVTWGNICDDSTFGYNEANVICNQLGYNGVSSYGNTGVVSLIWNNPYSGQLRLIGGTYSNQGRLEIYCNGQWGTVCDDQFGAFEASVACRQLGYSGYSRYQYTSSLAGSSSQPIWLDGVSCASSQITCLSYCESCPSFQYHNCLHSEDMTLECEFSTSATSGPYTTLSTCQNADSAANIGAILGGIFAFLFLVCGISAICIPICIFFWCCGSD